MVIHVLHITRKEKKMTPIIENIPSVEIIMNPPEEIVKGLEPAEKMQALAEFVFQFNQFMESVPEHKRGVLSLKISNQSQC